VINVKAVALVSAQNSTNTNNYKLKITTAANTFTALVTAGAKNLAANGLCVIDVDLIFTAVGASGSVTTAGVVWANDAAGNTSAPVYTGGHLDQHEPRRHGRGHRHPERPEFRQRGPAPRAERHAQAQVTGGRFDRAESLSGPALPAATGPRGRGLRHDRVRAADRPRAGSRSRGTRARS
jgi:hypothetical protein